jgi:hypothetical protein
MTQSTNTGCDVTAPGDLLFQICGFDPPTCSLVSSTAGLVYQSFAIVSGPCCLVRRVSGLVCRAFALFSMLALAGCSVTQPVRVLDAGEIRLAGSIGGPIVPSSVPTVVVPYGTVGGMFGISKDLTVTGNLHVILAALKTFGIDGGAAVRLIPQEGFVPEVTVKGQVLIMSSFAPESFRVFPYCSINGSYLLGESLIGYAGVESMFQFTGDDHFFVGPFAGVDIALSRRVALQVETKWMAANINTLNGVFEGQSSFRGMGSAALFLGVTYVW